MADRGFRNNDRVTVHGWMLADGVPAQGRVVCVNRVSKYDESVVVLSEAHGTEHVLTFKMDGRRYLDGSSCHITLGWKPCP